MAIQAKMCCLLGNFRRVRTVFLEGARGRKFTELVADHVFRHEDGNKGLAVMNHKGVTDEVRRDGRTARPSLNGFFRTSLDNLVDFFEEPEIHEGTFFE